MRGARLVGLLALLALVWGCSPGQEPELSGTVKFDGKPLSSGTLWVVGADGRERHAGIGPEGQYSVQGVPKGKAVFYIKSHPRVPEGLSKGEGTGALKLPGRYESAETSGLEVEVTGRDQKFDVLMKTVSEK